MLEILWIIIAFFYVKLGLWLARALARRARDVNGQRAVKAAVAVVFILIPTWDVILGRAYFYYLCATEGGVRVYKRVDLEPEYRDVQFPSASWIYEKLPLAQRYPYGYETAEDLPGPGEIGYIRDFVRDGRSGEALGTITHFSYGGGWLVNSTGLQGGGGEDCGQLSGDYFKVFLEDIFTSAHQ